MKNSKPDFDEIIKESRQLFRDIGESPDRAAVITAAAILDDLLDLLLRATMLDNDKVVIDLLEKQRLFSFATRIDLCYSLGLISKSERMDLHVIRKIRNDFAHSWKSVDYNDESTVDRCGEFELAKRFWAISGNEPADTQTQFVSEWVLLANQLCLRIKNCRHADKVSEMEDNTPIIFGGGTAPEAGNRSAGIIVDLLE